MNQIIAITKFLQRSYFVNYLKHSNGISNSYPIITSKWKPVHRFAYQMNTMVYTQKLYLSINRYKQ